MRNALTRPQQDSDDSKSNDGRFSPPSPTLSPLVALAANETHQPLLSNMGVQIDTEQRPCRMPNNNERSGTLESSGVDSVFGDFVGARTAQQREGGSVDDVSKLTKPIISGGGDEGGFLLLACDSDNDDEERDGVSGLQQPQSSNQAKGFTGTISRTSGSWVPEEDTERENEPGSTEGAGEGHAHPRLFAPAATDAAAEDDSSNSDDSSEALRENWGANGFPEDNEDDTQEWDDDDTNDDVTTEGGETHKGAASTRNWRSVDDNCWSSDDFSDANLHGKQLGDK